MFGVRIVNWKSNIHFFFKFPVGVSFIGVNFYAGQVLPIMMCFMYGIMIVDIFWKKSKGGGKSRRFTAFDIKLVSSKDISNWLKWKIGWNSFFVPIKKFGYFFSQFCRKKLRGINYLRFIINLKRYLSNFIIKLPILGQL